MSRFIDKQLALCVLFFITITSSALASPQKCRALVLEGGGDKGAYEAGAIYGLINSLAAEEIQYDVLSGVSIGALNAALLATVPKGQESAIASKIVDFWRNLTKEQIFKGWSAGYFEGIFFESGLFDNSPSKDLFKKLFTTRPNQRKIAIPTVDLENGSYIRWTEKFFTEANDTEFIDVLTAATSIPVFFPFSRIQNRSLVDGGALINLDVSGAIRRCFEVVESESDIIVDIVLTTARELQRVQEENAKTLPMLMRYLDITSYKNSITELIHASRDHPKVNFRYIIKPSGKLPGNDMIPLDFNTADIQKMITMGLTDAQDAVKKSGRFTIEDIRADYREMRKSRYVSQTQKRAQAVVM